MQPIKRSNRGRELLDHENRIDVLERRIPVDYPQWGGQLLDFTGNLTGPVSHIFDFTFPDECDDPTGVACEDTFVTNGQYLLLPVGFGFAPFWVTMTVGMSGGGTNIHNMYTMVTPGTLGETDEVSLFVLYEVWQDNAPLGNVTGNANWSWAQVPPPAQGHLYDRVFSITNLAHGQGVFNTENQRWALKFGIQLSGTAGPTSFIGVCAVGMMPPNSGALPSFGI